MKMGIEKAILFSFFLLLLAIPISGQGYTTTQTYVVVAEAKVEVRDLTLSSASVYPGGSIDFSVSLRNFGTASTTVTAEVRIYDASDQMVGTVSYDPIVLVPEQMATVQKTWGVGSLPIGNYRTVAQAAYESNLTNTVEKTFSIVRLPSAPPTQPMGQLQPIILPSLITPTEGKAVFLKTTILKELLAGEGDAESISLKNIGESILNITFSLGGIPGEWITLPFDKTLILPDEIRVVNFGLSIPNNALPGDYLLTLKANGGANSTDFLALRVKSYTSGYDKPIALKTIRIDEKEEKTLVSIELKNPSRNTMEVVQLQERIPSSLRDDQIEFVDKQGSISEVNGAKTITWEFSNIKPQESFYISYNIKGIPLDYSTYMNWHVSQILVTERQNAAELVKILDVTSSGIDESGSGEVSASVLYTGSEPTQVTILLEVPQGFNAEPAAITRTFIPKAVTSVTFKLTAPKTTQDTHMIRLVVLGSDFSTYMSAPVIVKRAVTQPSFSLLSILSLDQVVLISAFVAAGVVAISSSIKLLGRRHKAEYNPERLNYLKSIKGMVVGKDKK